VVAALAVVVVVAAVAVTAYIFTREGSPVFADTPKGGAMRTVGTPAVLVDVGQSVTVRGEKLPKEVRLLAADEAMKGLDEYCCVEMTVRSVGRSPKGKYVFLNSEADYKDPRNFAALLEETAVAQLRAHSIDPRTYFTGKKIRVTGLVTEYKERLEIRAVDEAQIEEVE
jgi:hypothetical protein